MIGKWHCINPLTIEERRLIKEGIDADLSYYKISLLIGRDKSVIRREISRRGGIKKYNPDTAQADFELKQKNCCGRKLKNTR